NNGDTFGEEALISSNKRNATVTMLSNGTLNRLSKDDFIELLNEPLLDWLSYEDAQKLIIEENAAWLDVRLPAEHQTDAINSSLHIPLIFLRMKIDTLNQDTPYIVYCDTGRRSSAAAFLLNERGFNTYILKDGISSVPEEIRTSQDSA
ncbi:MAG: rhodanese-like domain-containing protein, partial [Gammaproteobacteria bacterium]|nr:rhodanese-like domain-containing protein [Gammaproteobacteria bacterium]